MFAPTAFYTRLIMETFNDIVHYMIIYLLVITAFANVLYILNGQREGDERLFTDKKTGSEVSNAWMGQYMISLGEYDFEGFDSGYMWAIFFVATFFIHITFLNMPIAIMENTYDKVQERTRTSEMREKINILSDYWWVNAVF